LYKIFFVTPEPHGSGDIFIYGGKQCKNLTTRDTLHAASVQRSR